MTERKYLPTIAELIDRLSIVLMKSIFIVENRQNYLDEIRLIRHDLANINNDDYADFIYAILVLMLSNHAIWNNEMLVRSGEKNFQFDEHQALRMTHSVNGVRNRAKNKIAKYFGERVDLKVDCLAADLPSEFGNWNVFE